MRTIKELQEFLGVTPDGLWGKKSQDAFDEIFHAVIAEPTGPVVDVRSEANIATLHSKVQLLARKLIKTGLDQGMTFKVTSGTRTYEEQDKLFAQGGVTKARGGQSNHNFGLAFDITEFREGQPIWDSLNYRKMGKIGKSFGLSWGGDWNSIVDEPHFELRPGWAKNLSESEMLAGLRQRHANQLDQFS